MVAVTAWFAVQDDSDDAPPPPTTWSRYRAWHRRSFTWVHLTRLLGVAGFVFIMATRTFTSEFLILDGILLLGPDAARNVFGGGK